MHSMNIDQSTLKNTKIKATSMPLWTWKNLSTWCTQCRSCLRKKPINSGLWWMIHKLFADCAVRIYSAVQTYEHLVKKTICKWFSLQVCTGLYNCWFIQGEEWDGEMLKQIFVLPCALKIKSKLYCVFIVESRCCVIFNTGTNVGYMLRPTLENKRQLDGVKVIKHFINTM